MLIVFLVRNSSFRRPFTKKRWQGCTETSVWTQYVAQPCQASTTYRNNNKGSWALNYSAWYCSTQISRKSLFSLQNLWASQRGSSLCSTPGFSCQKSSPTHPKEKSIDQNQLSSNNFPPPAYIQSQYLQDSFTWFICKSNSFVWFIG